MLTSVMPQLKSSSCPACMQKLDRLEWTAGLSFVSHGARIGIRVNDPAIMERLQACLPPGAKPTASPVVDHLYSLILGGSGSRPNVRRYNLLYWGPGRLARSMELDEVLEQLESSLHFTVAVGARRRLFVHAGVVSWGGKAIVIPGRSMAGKTTLVAALVRAGATYMSDEYAALDDQGRAARQSLPVGLVAITEYKAEARWRPRVLSPGHAMLALLDNTVLARYRPEQALTTLQRVASGATSLKSKRGEADALAPRLLKQLEGSIQ